VALGLHQLRDDGGAIAAWHGGCVLTLVYAAKLDGSEKRALTLVEGNVTGVAHASLSDVSSRKGEN
jgi:hypothetical protein